MLVARTIERRCWARTGRAVRGAFDAIRRSASMTTAQINIFRRRARAFYESASDSACFNYHASCVRVRESRFFRSASPWLSTRLAPASQQFTHFHSLQRGSGGPRHPRRTSASALGEFAANLFLIACPVRAFYSFRHSESNIQFSDQSPAAALRLGTRKNCRVNYSFERAAADGECERRKVHETMLTWRKDKSRKSIEVKRAN